MTYREVFEAFEKHPTSDDGHMYTDISKVGGYRVRIDLEHDSREPGTYHAAFRVYNQNGIPSISRGMVSNPLTAAAIGHHVASSLHGFVDRYRPKSLVMYPNDSDPSVKDKKDAKYSKLADHLARHFNGKAEHDPDAGSRVTFREVFMETPEMMNHYSAEKSDPTIGASCLPGKSFDHVSTTPSGHKVWKREIVSPASGDRRVTIAATAPDGKMDVRVTGTVFANAPSEFHVNSLDGYIGGTLKAHDFYHHIVHNHYDMVSDNVHSMGGRKTWARLASKPDIAMTVRQAATDPHTGHPMKNMAASERPTSVEDMPNHYSDTDKEGGPKNYSRFVARAKK